MSDVVLLRGALFITWAYFMLVVFLLFGTIFKRGRKIADLEVRAHGTRRFQLARTQLMPRGALRRRLTGVLPRFRMHDES